MIAKALKLIRQYHELDRSETAAKLGLSKDYILALESGKKPIDRNILNKYSEAFDIPVSSLTFFIVESPNLNKKRKISEIAKEKMAGKILDIMEWSIKKDGKLKSEFKA
ncbi:helix-turn-helix transcriptional regulator [Acinetobacter baumannii]|uniref:helix-turn-helix domain-containing protein n=1 Tax=Acinetobacter baumannii TaxID=470 RepID=UPI0026F0A7F7|nr:helix-turn-helix transcriptional regulator [Acinetobacter baumannii]MDO7352402.1 helix-turn-helix transcriptional regulator [Acinetobacter baumannii]MDO7406369.1 helix-turn-helix transcriptional regulator [Acinetobacter baumannii]